MIKFDLGMPDFQKLEWRFIKKKATLQDCYKIYLAIETLPQMFEAMIKHDGKNSFLIREIFTNPLNVN
jgi:DNA mismatch repair protein MSH2